MRNILLAVIFLITNAVFANNDLLYSGPPVFHGAQVVGNRPGTELIFTVPATGQRPIAFSAQDLPQGLALDATNGILRGVVKAAGEYTIKVKAVNAAGQSQRDIKLVIGDKLCLTPPMGWNSWNVFTNTLDEKMVMDMADAMVSNGMRDLGYQYLNMDDYWHAASRDSSGRPVADAVKFPHGIKYLSDYVHSKGLKLGIYSDAGDKTCGECFGGFKHEELDAQVYAEWGIDLLKYDYCYVPWKKKETLKRYQKMGAALKATNRSIVYSICNWGIFKPWEWAPAAGAQYWRTTPDIFDTWRGGLPFMESNMMIMRRNTKLHSYAGPGQWNDPDMLTVGNYGKGKATGRNGMFKGMSDVEYESQMAMWAMMCSPLLSSCDLRNMNEATKGILMNTTLLRINQDALGRQAKLLSRKKGVWLFKKELKDGSVAIAVFNAGKQKDYLLDIKGIAADAPLAQITTSGYSIASADKTDKGLKLKLKKHETVVLILPGNYPY